MKQSIIHFNHAIELNPRYAEAFSGLAVAYTALGYTSYWAPTDSFPKARDFADKALQIDSSLAEARASLAFVKLSYVGSRRSGHEDSFHRLPVQQFRLGRKATALPMRCWREPFGDVARKFALQTEDFTQITVIFFRPEMTVGMGVIQLRGDPDAIARTGHRTLDHGIDTQFASDIWKWLTQTLVLHDRSTRDDAQSRAAARPPGYSVLRARKIVTSSFPAIRADGREAWSYESCRRRTMVSTWNSGPYRRWKAV